ncbi:MAG: UBP-type zinc finger domain-containing protein [Betaproteobacteria bacterium]
MTHTPACTHLELVADVTPSARGCEDCLAIGASWVHLRLCLVCGHVGCCDDSPNRHATKHFRATRHPVMRSFEPGEAWGYCYVDDLMFDPMPGPLRSSVRAAHRR